MPLKPGKKNVGANISELHKGPKYATTKAKHGKQTANKQAVVIAEKTAGNSMSREAKRTKQLAKITRAQYGY